jgi:hypothetical protein
MVQTALKSMAGRIAASLLRRQLVRTFVAQSWSRIPVKTLACHPYCELIEKILQRFHARVRSAPREALVASVLIFLNGDDSWLANSFLLSS